jgi:hypothetical protein
VGSKEQLDRMKVPIMEAPFSSTVSILWQIDIGFYDELPWVQQQIVKGECLTISTGLVRMLILTVWEVVRSKEEASCQ